jgi:hypothetical protein
MEEFLLIVGVGATVVPALLAFVFNFFRPEASPTRLGCLAAGVAPLLILIYVILFIAAGLAEPRPLTPLPMSEIVNGLALDAAAVLIPLAVGYVVARLILSALRR